MDPNTAIAWASFFIALLAGGGLTLQRTKVRELRQDVNDERGRTTTARAEVADLKIRFADAESRHDRERAEDHRKIAQLESDLRHAEQLATGAEQWSAIESTLLEHDKKALRQVAFVENQVKDVQGAVSNLAEEFRQLAQRWEAEK